MSELSQLKIIAHIRSDFSEKFGIPRQSGLVDELRAAVILEPEYRDPAAFRGIGGFSHLWLVWQFSQAVRQDWSPTVRPPRLGGNTVPMPSGFPACALWSCGRIRNTARC